MYQRDYTIRDTIQYLNKVAGTSFCHAEVSTINNLFNLKKEGFTLEDFKTVVDKKWAEWQGTKFQQYVRPETLFGKNFKTYLNEQPRIRKNKFHKLAESVGKAKQHDWKLD
jgi:uncharacterized phage protein (TIGR02220 family)